jgi:hypothetical protein
MKALLVIKTRNGYATLPFTGEIPRDTLADLSIATRIDKSYSSGAVSLVDVVEDYFEPVETPEITSIKVAA